MAMCFQSDVSAKEIIGKKQNRYIIGSGDVLSVVTWKEPDFSREEILVRIDGNISLPLLNDVQAAGKTPMQLKSEIEKGLQNFIENPVVTVTVTDPQSQRFYILGEVRKTGEYSLNKQLTVLQAFALAGGFTEWASKDEIILFRSEGKKNKVFRIPYKEIIETGDFSVNILLKANDTIIVP